MKDRKQNILKEAIVLLIVSAMVLTAIPAVTADANDQNYDSKSGGFEPFFSGGEEGTYLKTRLNVRTPDMGGFGQTVIYDNGLPTTSGVMASQYAANQPFNAQVADDFILDDNYQIEDVHWWGGFWNGPPDVINPCDFNVFIYADDGGKPTGSGMANPEITALASYFIPGVLGTLDVDLYQYDVDLVPPFSATSGVRYWIVMQAVFGFPPQYGSAPTTIKNLPARQGFPELSVPFWDTILTNDMAFYLTGSTGGGPSGECLEDQCDFELVSINNILVNGQPIINSLPQIINITIRNNGEVAIPEIKLLADVYEKVCGPTTELCCDKVYDLCDWETDPEVDDDWDWADDGDGDTFVLQGGPGNRWLTNDQAWRCTAGEDRSYGGDDDVYLGLSPIASGYDMLTWHCAEKDIDGDGIFDYTNDISGAACATFTFNHWCEGEYTFDADDNVVPVDYGTIAYSLDGGINFVELPIGDFVAYDTEDAWEEVTLKFINTNLYAAYSKVCEDCGTEEGDIVIEEAFPLDAKLWIRFIWHKDVCSQYEGWYIDETCLTRTEMYEKFLVHQTHEFFSMLPCVGEPKDIYYEFPLGWNPEPDTWYEICILGQVFDCPDCCEQIFENNEMCLQFEVSDIHDMACVDIVVNNPPVGLFYNEGDDVCVDMTVQNMGTFAENNVPVDLKVGKRVLDRAIDEDFETNPSSRWDFGPFSGGDLKDYWDWTDGRTDVNSIGSRSILPGDESMICAEEGFAYPYLPEGAACGMFSPDVFDVSNAVEAHLNFFAKWSVAWGDDNGDGYVDNYACMLIHPTSGPDSASWWITIDGMINYQNDYSNEWMPFSIDIKDLLDGFKYDSTIPDFEIGFAVLTEVTDDGIVRSPTNPIPWDGLMLDNIQLDIVSCQDLTVADTQYTGALLPGQTETLTLCWNDTTLCNWCLCGDVQLDTDIDTTNDVCCVEDGVRVKNTYPVENWKTWDLTEGEGECLWHICCTRNCDGTCCAWAGVEEETHAHYVNDMDDSLISPVYNLEDYGMIGAPYGIPTATGFGVWLELTTWYQFFEDDAGDFGEIYVRRNSTSPWVKIGEVTDNSSGFFETLGFYIDPWYCNQTQFKFRIVTDDADYSEGWYICEVCIYEVDDLIAPPFGSPGDTIMYQPVTDSTGTWSFINVDGSLGYAGIENFEISSDVPIGGVSIVGLSIRHDGTTWVAFDPLDTVLTCEFYDDPYSPLAPPTNLIDTFTLTGLNADSITLTGDSYSGYPAYEYKWTLPNSVVVADQDGWMYLTGPTGYSPLWGDSDDTLTGDSDSYQVDAGIPALTADDRAMGLYEGQANAIPVIGDLIGPCEDFDRFEIAPWTCEKTFGGNYWDTERQNISGYPSDGNGLNNAMYTLLDFTDPDLTYVEFFFTTEWDIEDGCHAYIEISSDWDGASPMDSATWILYWEQAGPSQEDGKTSRDFDYPELFVLNEYIGQEIYIRFRYTTPGNGFPTQDGYWEIQNKKIIFKEQSIDFVDAEPPVTNIFFDSITAKVTLFAQDYPLAKNSGLKATYYKIDTGDFKIYNAPFTLSEGTHTVYYYSEDNAGNKESQKSQTYTVDTTPPTVTLTSPKEGWLYLFGSPIMERILSDTTLCIGRVPIAAEADDAGGSGVFKVLFSYNGGTGWDDTAPYEDEFKGMKFGSMTIKATAIDKVGLESAPDEITVNVYSLGLF